MRCHQKELRICRLTDLHGSVMIASILSKRAREGYTSLSFNPNRMLKKSTSFVLASCKGSTYDPTYASPFRSLRPRWMAYLNILPTVLVRLAAFKISRVNAIHSSSSTAY